MTTFDTVECVVVVRLEVLAGGAYDEPGPLTTEGADGLHYGPTADVAAREELKGLVLRPYRLGFWRRIFYNTMGHDWPFNKMQIVEVVTTNVTHSEYASGE